MDIKYKQFVIIPRKPKMSKGKLCSQSCHATFMALEKQRGICKEDPNYFDGISETIIDEWKENGMCVIVLQCKKPIELFGIAHYLEQWNVPHHLYIDEGLTEVSPFTPTALATGVLSESQFWYFEQMGLFK